MGPWTYYTPSLIGLLLPFGMHEAIFAHPAIAALSPGMQWTVLTLIAIVLAIEFQLLMIGAQGAFAQVLPAPRGRSIRGRSAVITGVLIIASVVLSWITRLLWSETISTPVVIVGICSGLTAIVAILIYLWSWPMAIRDFAAR